MRSINDTPHQAPESSHVTLDRVALSGVNAKREDLGFALVPCAFSGSASSEIQLTPAGAFSARAGDVRASKVWRIDAAIAEKVIARLSARKTPFVIDYEHQTLHSEVNGQPAPAAGWAKGFEWREGVGLFAINVEWTPRAAAMIEAGEYKFLSPVLLTHKTTGEVVDILHAALTNFPALDGMQDVTERIAARLGVSQTNELEPNMDLLKQLLAALNLPETTSETTALTAVTALKAKADTAARAETELASLKASNGAATDAMRQLQTQVAALQASIEGDKKDALIAEALKVGKLVPAQEVWARTQTVDALNAYIAVAPAMLGVGATQTSGKGPAGEPQGDLSALEVEVCKNLGLTPEQFKKSRAAA